MTCDGAAWSGRTATQTVRAAPWIPPTSTCDSRAKRLVKRIWSECPNHVVRFEEPQPGLLIEPFIGQYARKAGLPFDPRRQADSP